MHIEDMAQAERQESYVEEDNGLEYGCDEESKVSIQQISEVNTNEESLYGLLEAKASARQAFMTNLRQTI